MTLFTARGSPAATVDSGVIQFLGTSGAGNGSFVNEGAPAGSGVGNARTTFSGSATADSANLVNKSGGGLTEFLNSASAATGTFTNEGATDDDISGGLMEFTNTANAAEATFIVNGSSSTTAFEAAEVTFSDSSTAEGATFTINGGTVSGAPGGVVSFLDTSTAGESIFVVNGAAADGASGGQLTFGRTNSTAANATLILNAGEGENGGGLCILGGAIGAGGTPRIEIYGNGLLIVTTNTRGSESIGSIEGDGRIQIASHSTMLVGANNLKTTFSGLIEDAGSLEKTGTGTLTLSGASTYTGSTAVNQGALLAANTNASATGTGAVRVTAGTLGGSGIIAGVVTIGTGSGTGAFLAPAFGTNKQVTLTLQSSLTLQADATYTYAFKARKNQARTDLVVANAITINGATIALQGQTQGRVKRGTVLTALSNTGATPISGTFGNLADGAIITVNGNNFQANYEGGDGNDLTLTVVR
jgi:autotransporter-associated beta strand protein